MSRRTEDQMASEPASGSIGDLPDADLRLLTRLLRMKPAMEAHSKSGEQWLQQQEAQMNDRQFPDSLKRPRGLVDRLRLNWAKHGMPFCPKRANLCMSHRNLDPRIIRALMLLVTDECTIRVDRYRHLQSKRELHPQVQNWLTRIDNLTVLWLGKDCFEQTYNRMAPRNVGPASEHCKCEACILAAIGGDSSLLTDLRASVLGRFNYARDFAKANVPTPRLLRILESWMQHHDAVTRYAIESRSYVLAPHVTAVRKVYHDRVRARIEQGRLKHGKHPRLRKRVEVKLTKEALPIPRVPRVKASRRRGDREGRGGDGGAGSGAVRRSLPIDGGMRTVSMNEAMPRAVSGQDVMGRGMPRFIQPGEEGKMAQVENWLDIMDDVTEKFESGGVEPMDGVEQRDDSSDSGSDSVSAASDVFSEEQAGIRSQKQSMAHRNSTPSNRPSQTANTPANHLHIYNNQPRNQNPFVSREDYIAPLNLYVIRRNKNANNPYEFRDSVYPKANQEAQAERNVGALPFDGVNMHSRDPCDTDLGEADALGFALDGYDAADFNDDGVSWTSVTPVSSKAPSLRSISTFSEPQPITPQKQPQPKPTQHLNPLWNARPSLLASSVYSSTADRPNTTASGIPIVRRSAYNVERGRAGRMPESVRRMVDKSTLATLEGKRESELSVWPRVRR